MMAANVPKVESVPDFKGFAKLAKRKKEAKFGSAIAWEYGIWKEFDENVKLSVLSNQCGREVWKVIKGTAVVGPQPASQPQLAAVQARDNQAEGLPPGMVELSMPAIPTVGEIPVRTAARNQALLDMRAAMETYMPQRWLRIRHSKL